jgi:hypothetical protein
MVQPSAGNEHTFSQWQYIAGLKQHWQWNWSIPSEGANVQFNPGPLIPPSQVQQDDFDQWDNSSPHKQDSQEQDGIATSTQKHLTNNLQNSLHHHQNLNPM